MFRTLRCTGAGLLAVALAGPISAESTPGPPDWADTAGSIYLNANDHKSPTAEEPVKLAVHEAPASPPRNNDIRHLAPPTSGRLSAQGAERDDRATGVPSSLRQPLEFGMPQGSLPTILSALAIVIGAFLILAWLLRRGGPKTGMTLPGDVVSVLGRVPLAARQFAHLLRVGNKLVLVALTPSGAETITEVNDPVEVDRIVGLCQQFNPHSTTKAFEHVFRQLSRESAPVGFGESLPQTISSAAAAYRAQRGDSARA